MVNEDDDTKSTERGSSQSQFRLGRHNLSNLEVTIERQQFWEGTMGRISNGTLGPQLGGHHQHPPVGQQPSPVQSSYQLIHHGTLYRMEELLLLMDRMLTVASVCTKLGRNPNAA